MLALDIGVFHKKAHAISVKEALWWSAFWIGLAGLFAIGVYFFRSTLQASEFTGFKLFFSKDDVEFKPESSWTLKMVRRFFGVSKHYHEDKFFIKKMGYVIVTPLFLVLALVETTDLVFALDSIPAVLAVSSDPFIVYTSNIFAILGLRSLYFALAGVVGLFHYLNYGLAIILSFIGVKMMISGFYHVPIHFALLFVLIVLAASVIFSLIFPKKEKLIEHP